MNFKVTLVFIFSLFLGSCDSLLLEKEIGNTPNENFDVIWKEFDEKYGLFEPKNIDWGKSYDQYKPQINNSMSDSELYAVLTAMLDPLNDSHVALVPTPGTGLPMYRSGVLGKLDTIADFDLEILKSNYLPESKFEDPFFTYGILDVNIGYIHIEGFSDLPKYLKGPFETVMNALKDTKAIIIDVRGGYGGEDLAGQYLAGWFAQKEYPYMKSRVKSGSGKNDFTEWEEWKIMPEGTSQYTKPVMVLTHRFTISARETFCLAMKVLPQVTFIGDTTTGAFSNQINRELPNGWGYSLSIGQWTDANGFSFEGVGLAPNILVKNKKEELLAGSDSVLEKAIDLINK